MSGNQLQLTSPATAAKNPATRWEPTAPWERKLIEMGRYNWAAIVFFNHPFLYVQPLLYISVVNMRSGREGNLIKLSSLLCISCSGFQTRMHKSAPAMVLLYSHTDQQIHRDEPFHRVNAKQSLSPTPKKKRKGRLDVITF